jgi:hypothetical protein
MAESLATLVQTCPPCPSGGGARSRMREKRSCLRSVAGPERGTDISGRARRAAPESDFDPHEEHFGDASDKREAAQGFEKSHAA